MESNRNLRCHRISNYVPIVVLTKQGIKLLLILIVLVLIKILTLWKPKNPLVHKQINRENIKNNRGVGICRPCIDSYYVHLENVVMFLLLKNLTEAQKLPFYPVGNGKTNE